MVRIHPALLSASAFALVLLLSSGGCRSERITFPPDTTPPLLQVLSPVDTAYDMDGDHLVDLSVRWSDGNAIDTASVVVRSLEPINGTATTATNLRTVWRVGRLDSAGFILRETLANLLPDGANRLLVSVRDTAGNETVDTVLFQLPSIVYHDSIVTGVTSTTNNIRSIVIDQAGRRGYAGVSSRIIVFDPESLTVLANVPSGNYSQVMRILLDEPRGIAYVSGNTLERIDLTTLQLLGPLTGAFSYAAIAYSRGPAPLLYAGGTGDGWIGYFDLNAAAKIDFMAIPHAENEFVNDIVVMPGDAKLYVTRYADDGGLLVIDPSTKQIVRDITTLNGGPFFTDDLELTADNRYLYVVLRDAYPLRGIGVLDTQADSLVRFLNLHAYVPFALRLSPSQRRMFVTTFDVSPSRPSENVLINTGTLDVLSRLPRPRLPGAIRRDAQPVFRPDGKLVFVGRELTIDVYLHRERP